MSCTYCTAMQNTLYIHIDNNLYSKWVLLHNNSKANRQQAVIIICRRTLQMPNRKALVSAFQTICHYSFWTANKNLSSSKFRWRYIVIINQLAHRFCRGIHKQNEEERAKRDYNLQISIQQMKMHMGYQRNNTNRSYIWKQWPTHIDYLQDCNQQNPTFIMLASSFIPSGEINPYSIIYNSDPYLNSKLARSSCINRRPLVFIHQRAPFSTSLKARTKVTQNINFLLA